MAEANKISTDADLLDQVGQQAAGQTTGVPEITAVSPTVKTDELLDTSLLGTDPQAGTAQVNLTGLEATVPTTSTPDLGQIDSVEKIRPEVTAAPTAQHWRC